MGVFPGRDTGCAESGCFPRGETVVAQKTGVPRTRLISVCIIGLLLYKLGLSANWQEALSTCIDVLLNYNCI